ncbi:hypothetical protein BCR42DRAFT_413335 [Absidia repens]|uniref:ZZ-type domain-containing protein n=1 Tax=Absidia repens TaxID=90262 RepID=A0A1X2IJ65_9FUNG|nr:hypothetical protein BCR42DRAFT_413335 [Absidia repens]
MVLKVKLENTDAYRVLWESPYINYATSFDLFRKEIRNLLSLENDDFDVLYLDADGDLVVLTSYSEIHDMHPRKKNYRLIVQPKKAEADPIHKQTKNVSMLSEETLQPISSSSSAATTDNISTAPTPTPAPTTTPPAETPALSSQSPPGFTAFAHCLQNALNQWTNDLTPLHQMTAHRSQEQARQVSGFALGALDNALRTAAETATNIHQTVSPILQRHASYPNYRQRSHQQHSTRHHHQTPTATTSCNSGKSFTAFDDPSKSTMYCDICFNLIDGEHWSCSQCADYHVCTQCHSSGTVFHNPLHGLQHIESIPKPSTGNQFSDHPSNSSHAIDLKNTDTIHGNVVCDHCGANIVGIRYKCGHCLDYDLCETCEPLLIHDQRHVFLKIRRPLSPTASMVTTFLPVFDYAVKPTESTTHEKPEANPANIDTPVEQQQPLLHRAQSIASSSFGTSNGLLSAVFVDDVNLPDGSEIQPSQRFLKVWKIKNNGRVRWPTGSTLIFSGGDILRPYPAQYQQSGVVPAISPGEETRIAIELSAPDAPGRHVGYFRLSSPEGIRFGDRLWCDIVVASLPNTCSMKHKLAQSAPHEVTSLSSSPIVSTISTSATTVKSSAPTTTTSMVYPAPSTNHDNIHTIDRRHSTLSCLITTPTEPSVCTTTTNDNGSTDYGADDDDYDPFQDPYIVYGSVQTSARSIGSQTGTINSDNGTTASTATQQQQIRNNNNESYRSSTSFSTTHSPKTSSCTDYIIVKNRSLDQDQVVPEPYSSSSSYPVNSRPNEKSPLASLSNSSAHMDGYEWVGSNQLTNASEFKYAQQLAHLHEMGITFCDEMAIKLLIQHDGNLDIVLPEILDLA